MDGLSGNVMDVCGVVGNLTKGFWPDLVSMFAKQDLCENAQKWGLYGTCK